jgi:hypothetical protein
MKLCLMVRQAVIMNTLGLKLSLAVLLGLNNEESGELGRGFLSNQTVCCPSPQLNPYTEYREIKNELATRRLILPTLKNNRWF